MQEYREKVICQNCKKDFIIEPEDFAFYEKIKVPQPTFCPECRRQRRMSWRNERALYRRKCDLCFKNIFSMYHDKVSFPVYCHDCWYGDKWDPASYGKKYDMSRSFFEQYKELSERVPKLALWQRNAINSEYSNMCAECKNVYLSISVVKESENIFYSKCIDKSKDIVDCLNVISNSGILYENTEAQSNYNSQYLLLCRNCLDSYYLFDCINCSNCFMCFNLRNKEYCIKNRQFSKEEYFKELLNINFKSRNSREILLKEFDEIKKRAIFRFGNITRVMDSTGNNLLNVKNCKNCFEVYNAENSSYCYRAFDFKDSMDFDYGQKSELLYEYSTGALNDYNVRFSVSALNSVRNAEYTEFCKDCSDIFGCISLRNENNAILNKIYSKEEYLKIREEIIKQMSLVPFIDKVGIKYEYGEFFPTEISPFGYNESLAQEIFPMTKNEIEKKGYSWYEPNSKNFKITLTVDKIPDNIDNVNEEILGEILECAHKGKCNQQCSIAFRITDYELNFYKKHDIPVPIFCPNCRHYGRYKVMPSLKLYKRVCMCDHKNHSHKSEKCKKQVETSYAPDRPEIVYCEACYNKEVY